MPSKCSNRKLTEFQTAENRLKLSGHVRLWQGTYRVQGVVVAQSWDETVIDSAP